MPPENPSRFSTGGGYFTSPARTPAGGVSVTVVGIRNSSRGWCAFTCQPGVMVASTTACPPPAVSFARTTSSGGGAADTATLRPTSTATAPARRIAPDLNGP